MNACASFYRESPEVSIQAKKRDGSELFGMYSLAYAAGLDEDAEGVGRRKGDAALFGTPQRGFSLRGRKELRPSSVRHEICAREASEPREGGLSCALGSKLP